MTNMRPAQQKYKRTTPDIEQLPGAPLRFAPRYSTHPPIGVFGSWADYLAAARKVSLWRMLTDPMHREEYPWFRVSGGSTTWAHPHRTSRLSRVSWNLRWRSPA